MNLDLANHPNTLQSQQSKNLSAILANLAMAQSELWDTLNASIKDKWTTTKETIKNILGTIKGWAAKRVYCDKDMYKNMYQKMLEQWTIIKHQIETIISHLPKMKKKPAELWKITSNYYNGLCNLLQNWEKKVNESMVYPDKNIWFNVCDWDVEMKWLDEKADIMNSMQHKIEDILYMNHIA